MSGVIGVGKACRAITRCRVRRGCCQPPPPIRNGHDGFLSSGSSGSKLRRGGAGFHDRFCSFFSFQQQEAVFLDKLLAVSLQEHSLLEVFAPCRVKGIRFSFDFDMAPDRFRAGPFELQPDGFAFLKRRTRGAHTR